MRWITPIALALVTGSPLLAGCGGSSGTSSSTAASGGPAQATSTTAEASERVLPQAQAVINDYPSTPPCAPGGISWKDEEICQHFWNHMLAWQPLADAARGPTMAGAGRGSMIYEGYENLISAPHWWGPDICGGNPKENANHCKGTQPGLVFGNSGALVESFDDGTEVKARVAWALRPGDVAFGNEYFMAYNNGGDGGSQHAFCSARSGSASGEWVSCSRVSEDGAQISTELPHDVSSSADYASYGWVLENYPVLVGIHNGIPNSKLVVNSAPTPVGVRFSPQASSPGITKGNASIAGSSDTSSPALWLAGYRTRTSDGSVTITGKLVADDPKEAGYSGALATVVVEFAQRDKEQKKSVDGREVVERKPVDPTCTVQTPTSVGDKAKCVVVEWIPGGRSEPGVLRVEIQKAVAG
jgi:hypothetical protein